MEVTTAIFLTINDTDSAAPYNPTEPSVMKHHISTYKREPNYTMRKDLLVRVGKYVPGPNYYPKVRSEMGRGLKLKRHNALVSSYCECRPVNAHEV